MNGLAGARRPLAVFGFSWLAWTLGALYFPPWMLLLMASLPALAFLIRLLWGRRQVLWRKKPPQPANQQRVPAGSLVQLFCVAGMLAQLVYLGYGWLVLRPVESLAGRQAEASAQVLETRPMILGETNHVKLKLLRLDGEAAPLNSKIELVLPDTLAVGDVVSFPLELALCDRANMASGYAKGVVLRGFARGSPVVTGRSATPLALLRKWQYQLGDSIRNKLPFRLGSVAAAMSAGDRRYLQAETLDAYRAAGLSHMLVVSGLHLSVLCALLRVVLGRLLPKRMAAFMGMVFVILLVGFTGCSPSVVRSGVVYLLVFMAGLFRRRADVYTSLGVAAMGLCIQNPYAVADVGLQLSFAATLGVLQTDRLAAKLFGLMPAESRDLVRRDKGHSLSWLTRAWHSLANQMSGSICVTAATLPVLAFAGMGVSLPSLFMNLVAVPLLAPIVVSGFVMMLPAGIPVLGWLASVAGLLAGSLLGLLERMTGWCRSLPNGIIGLGGEYILITILLVYLLVYFGIIAPTRPKALAFFIAAALLVPTAGLLGQGLAQQTVQITLAGSGTSASVVVRRGDQAVVLYRSRQSCRAVEQVLQSQRVKNLEILVDMRQKDHTTEYLSRLRPVKVIYAEEFVTRRVEKPMDGVELYLKKLSSGMVACVDVAGFKIGVTNRKVDLSGYPPLDLLLPGAGEVSADYRLLLTAGPPPEWAEGQKIRLTDSGGSVLLRLGKSLKFRPA